MRLPRVLVVDDEEAIRTALERALGLEGFAVATVDGGRAALDAVEEQQPDVVVLDILMPELDGVTVTKTLRAGDIVVDPARHEARRGDRDLALTRREFELLETFVRNAGIVLDRAKLLELVWGYDFAADGNVVDVFVGYLRRKLEAGGEPRVLHTVRGVGFVLRP